MHFQEALWSERVPICFPLEKSIASLSQRRLEASLLQRSEPVVHLQQARWSESVAISFSREKRCLPVSEREGSGGHPGLPLTLPRSSLRVLQLASLWRKVLPPCLGEGVVATLGSPLANGGASPHKKKGRIAQFHEGAGFLAIHKETGSSDSII